MSSVSRLCLGSRPMSPVSRLCLVSRPMSPVLRRCFLPPVRCPQSYVSVPCLTSYVPCLTSSVPCLTSAVPSLSFCSLSPSSALCLTWSVPCLLSSFLRPLTPYQLSQCPLFSPDLNSGWAYPKICLPLTQSPMKSFMCWLSQWYNCSRDGSVSACLNICV